MSDKTYTGVDNSPSVQMVATGGETHGYKPSSAEVRPAATPPAPPSGSGGGSKAK